MNTKNPYLRKQKLNGIFHFKHPLSLSFYRVAASSLAKMKSGGSPQGGIPPRLSCKANLPPVLLLHCPELLNKTGCSLSADSRKRAIGGNCTQSTSSI